MKYLALAIVLISPILATYALMYTISLYLHIKDFIGAIHEGIKAQAEYDKYEQEMNDYENTI